MRIRSRYLLSRWVGSNRLGRVAGILLCRVRLHQEGETARSTNGSASLENVAVLTGGALVSAIFFCPAAALYTSLDSVRTSHPHHRKPGGFLAAIPFVLRMRSMTSTGTL